MTTNKPEVINVYSTSFIGALDCVRLSDYEAMKSAYEEELFCVRQDRDAHFGELIRAIEQADALKDLLKMYKSALNKWTEKSEWVREEVEPSEIRMHRADVMKSRIEALQAECGKLRSELDAHKAARIAYASEFPPDDDGQPDVGSIHQNIRKLKEEARTRVRSGGYQPVVPNYVAKPPADE